MVRKYTLNEKYFETYSHNMAYILGLWWADGSIYKQTDSRKVNQFNITLLHEDYLLELILKELNSNTPLKIHKNTGAFVIKLNSVLLCNSIIKLGGKSNKSKDPGYPNLPNEYFPCFLRGVFDGDGGICKKKTAYISYITSGSISFLETIEKKIQDIDSSIKPYINRFENYAALRFVQSDTIRLGYILYKHMNQFFMKRKYDLFKEMYQLNKKCYNRLTDDIVLEIIELVKNNELKTYKDIENKFNISKSSIVAILSKRLRENATEIYSIEYLESLKHKLHFNNQFIKNQQGENTRKVSIRDVKTIRELFNSKQKNINELIKLYPLSYSAIYNIIQRKTWKHVV